MPAETPKFEVGSDSSNRTSSIADAKEFSIPSSKIDIVNGPCRGAPCNPGPGGPPPKCAPRPPGRIEP